jgi:hypothetical protein
MASAVGGGYKGLLSWSVAAILMGGGALASQDLRMGLAVAAVALVVALVANAEGRVRARDPDEAMQFLVRRLELAIAAAERESSRGGTASASARRSG